MKRHGKRYNESAKLVEPERRYPVEQAVATLKKFKPAKFDETVNLSLHLGIDPKQADQMVRGTISLPKGLGKEVRVIVFAPADKAAEGKKAGAVEAGADDLIKKVGDGWLDFDVAIATPDMMGKVGRLGRVLGPQGKMPTPKAGTVTADVAEAVTAFRAGKVEYRADETGNLHIPVGKRSFDDAALKENVTAVLDHIQSVRPAAVKGQFVLKAVLSATMSPGVQLATAQ